MLHGGVLGMRMIDPAQPEPGALSPASHDKKVDERKREDSPAALPSRDELSEQLKQLTAEHNALLCSLEYRLGHLILHRLPFTARLRAMLGTVSERLVNVRNWLTLLSLAAERRFVAESRNQYRVLTTVCWSFPIYSQTFVYQELTNLAQQGFTIRLIYSKLDSRDYLPPQFALLWKVKRAHPLHWKGHERDFLRYQKRMPEKVDTLVRKLCEASGMASQTLLQHEHFLQAFAFTRLVEAYRPHYIHSYFFYERSLMALIAAYLLDIPRGISCYADHLLHDYDLKVVPLHLEWCDVVIATSERIKRELLSLAPQVKPERILVKPNAIDTEYFPLFTRHEPAVNEPFRLVCVSRLDPKKGLLYLIEAIQLLCQRQVRVALHLVGDAEADDPYKRRLIQRIAAFGLENVVHLEGWQPAAGVQRCLQKAHVFVAPFIETVTGDKDGIPTALLEAMSTGLPAVATDAGSITEVITHRQDGIVVPQRDPRALADAIESLLRYPAQRQQMGREAAAKIRRYFDVRVCEQRFHTRLRTVLKS